ncbi:MAG: hypothetical protein ACR2HE_04775 [Casimicrobiaceae bacterium]
MQDTPASLENSSTDYIVALLKGTAGVIPHVGSMVAEVIGALIPNQRTDRIVDFIRKLSQNLADAQAQILRSRLSNPEALGLFEECLMQAARAYTEDRRKHLAAFVKEGLAADSFDRHRVARLLNLLTQVSDLELVMLQKYCGEEEEAKLDNNMRDLIVGPIIAIGTPDDVRSEEAIAESRKLHLVSLGLLRAKYPHLRKGDIPKFDPSTGGFQNSGYQTTRLGRMLLVYAGMRDEIGY